MGRRDYEMEDALKAVEDATGSKPSRITAHRRKKQERERAEAGD